MIFTGIGPHAARIRALVVDETPFVILDRRGGDHRLAVAEALQGELLALQLFLDGDAGVFPEKILTEGQRFFFCLKMITLHHDPLAACQTVRFNDDGFELFQKRFDAVQGRKIPEARISRDLILFNEITGEGFGGFQPGQIL